MKTIENKKTSILIAENKTASYADLIKLIINNPGREGFDLKAIKQRLEIISNIETAKDDKIEIENANIELIKKLVDEYKWATIHKEIVEFIEYIKSIS